MRITFDAEPGQQADHLATRLFHRVRRAAADRSNGSLHHMFEAIGVVSSDVEIFGVCTRPERLFADATTPPAAMAMREPEASCSASARRGDRRRLGHCRP